MTKLNPKLINTTGGTDGQALVIQGGELTWGNVAAEEGPSSPGWYLESTGTGVSQNITLTTASLAGELLVYVNGVYQAPSLYSVLGTLLTITAPLDSKITVVKQPTGSNGGGSGGVPEAPLDGKQYARKDATWSEVMASLPAGMLVLKPLVPSGGSDIRRIPSYWRSMGSASAAYNNMNNIHATPVWIPGMNIVGYTIHIQGGIAGSPIVEVGIFNSNADGEPGDLLVQHNFTATGTGVINQTLATPIPASAHSGKVWLGYAVNLGSGATIQFSHSVNSGLGPIEMGLTPSGTINNAAAGGFLISTGTLMGDLGTERVWPTSFGSYGLNNVANYPNLVLRVTRD